MTLTFIPQVQKALEFAGEKFVAAPIGIEGERWFFHQLIPMAGEAEIVHEVKDLVVEGAADSIRVRIYRPTSDNNLPAVIFFHGGSFYMGDLETHDRVTRALANASGSVVIAVDYRRSPEHPFPAPVDDAWFALQWVHKNASSLNVDSNRIAVVGDSAGANLAAIAARRARDAGAPKLMLQVLIYPTLDATLASGSWKTYAEGPILTLESFRASLGLYVPNANNSTNPDLSNSVLSNSGLTNPDVSPIYAESLAGVAPALIITAEHDPLRDEGEAYARKLEANGIETKYHLYPNMIHGFFQMSGFIDEGKAAMQEVASALKTAFFK